MGKDAFYKRKELIRGKLNKNLTRSEFSQVYDHMESGVVGQ